MRKKKFEVKSNDNESQMTPTGLFYKVFQKKPLLAVSLGILSLLIFLLLTYGDKVINHYRVENCDTWVIEGKILNSNKTKLASKISVGAMSGPFAIDDEIINGNFRITDVVIPKDEYIYLYLIDEKGSHMPIYREPFREGKHIVDKKRCRIIFREPIIITVQELPSISKIVKKPSLQKSYFIQNKNLDKLDSSINSLGYIKRPNKPTSEIEFSYTGQIEQIHESNLFRYDGGFLKLNVNGREMYIYSTLSIEQTSHIGNSRGQVLAEINHKIETLVRLNHEQCLKKILDYL